MKRGWAVLSLVLLLPGTGVAAAKPAYSLPEAVSEEDRDAAALARTCPSGQWRWERTRWPRQSVDFATPMEPRSLEIDMGTGRLTGAGRGEFGGELWAKHADGRENLISIDNVQGLRRTRQGAIVLFGLRHRSNRGHAMFVRDNGEHWPLRTIGALPGRPDAMVDIGNGEYGVRIAPNDDGKVRVSVISEYRVLGEASCIRDQRGRR